jgi:putative intracellular protease/amidase
MKVLIVCTNHEAYPTKTTKTGVWLSELTHFYDVMAKRRIILDFVCPKGGNVPVDERSLDFKVECNGFPKQA